MGMRSIVKGVRWTRDKQNVPLKTLRRSVGRISKTQGLDPSDDKKMVTIYLHQSTIRFFKKEASRHRTKYQRLIRAVLDEYRSLNQP